MKIRDLVGDLSYKEIKKRKWRIPRLWRDDRKILFIDYIISYGGIILRKTEPKEKGGNSYIGKRMKSFLNRDKGYLVINLCLKEKQYVSIRIHRILWETWVDRIPDGFEMNHKDGIKIHNNLKNLEVVTPKENMQHAKELGLNWTEEHRKAMSKVHKGKKLSEEQIKKLIEVNKGRKFSEEHKRKISESNKGKNKGKKHSIETRKKMSEAKSGEKHHGARLTKKSVRKIRYLYYCKKWEQQEIAYKFKVSIGCVNSIAQGYNWNLDHLTKEELMENYGN